MRVRILPVVLEVQKDFSSQWGNWKVNWGLIVTLANEWEWSSYHDNRRLVNF